MLKSIASRPWGLRLLAALTFLFLPLVVIASCVMIAYDEGFFDDFGNQMGHVWYALKTGRLR